MTEKFIVKYEVRPLQRPPNQIKTFEIQFRLGSPGPLMQGALPPQPQMGEDPQIPLLLFYLFLLLQFLETTLKHVYKYIC